MAGTSGTIGRAVADALLADGHTVTCLNRREVGVAKDARLAVARFDDRASLGKAVATARPSAVISCIASRSGAPKDAHAVDYQANSNLLVAAERAGAEHFILLSAICVQKPRLAFQHAKLAFEAELVASSIDHTIVRPTAFFKSLSGQARRVAKGGRFMLFGDGELTRCKPISDRDCARFVADCVFDPARRGQVLPIGGPGPAISLKEQGELLFEAARRKPRFQSISPRMFTVIARILSVAAPFLDWFATKAEYARIAHYYATESMLVLDPESGEYNEEMTPEFGEDRLADHYKFLLEPDG
ncbi:NAD(P)H-binding protein [Erythrobacter sp. THAF29]|uniref:NAD(P)H-binding protein n=1 Tax=Erythrobacter sp. THAF29 TaxID=2587851 RepID=UPI0012A9FB0E|nr:NAD(P)H-binding protein [Erythrobacter sp. THAF29]QFT78855.1 NmrA-like family protein [Erythrobacter sp. THAF29]